MPSSKETMDQASRLYNKSRANREAMDKLLRVSPEARDIARRQRQRRDAALARRFKHSLLAAIAVVVAIMIAASIFSIGFFSWLLMLLIFFGVIATGMLLYPRGAEPSFEKLAETELTALPSNTESWLVQQRKALPAPAARSLDQIAVRLEELRPQLANLDPREPAAVEVRRLVGVELPELVEGYKRVPDHLRREASHGGHTPEKQLVEGLDIVEGEISRMTRQLASGELDALATQGKYLELKYRGDEELNGNTSQ